MTESERQRIQFTPDNEEERIKGQMMAKFTAAQELQLRKIVQEEIQKAIFWTCIGTGVFIAFVKLISAH